MGLHDRTQEATRTTRSRQMWSECYDIVADTFPKWDGSPEDLRSRLKIYSLQFRSVFDLNNSPMKLYLNQDMWPHVAHPNENHVLVRQSDCSCIRFHRIGHWALAAVSPICEHGRVPLEGLRSATPGATPGATAASAMIF